MRLLRSHPRAPRPRPAPTARRPAVGLRRGAGGLAVLALALGLGLGPGAVPAGAHPAALDEYGGHFSEDGIYHYHRPSRDMATRKAEWLEWVRYPVRGIIKGRVARIEDASHLWLHIPYRPAYQELVPEVGAANRDDHAVLLRVALAHVSPEETGARDPGFSAWFREKVTHELRQKLLDEQVTVHFRIVGGEAGLLRSMVFQGEENVNLWMVLNGWSYYVISDGENPYDKLFRQAEDIAKRDRAGIWAHIR